MGNCGGKSQVRREAESDERIRQARQTIAAYTPKYTPAPQTPINNGANKNGGSNPGGVSVTFSEKNEEHTGLVLSPCEFLSKRVNGKPFNASDVTDFEAAKQEISLFRNYARRFLDNIESLGDGDDNETGSNKKNKGARAALRNNEDVKDYVKKVVSKPEHTRKVIFDAIQGNALFEDESEKALVEVIDVFKPANFNSGDCVIKQGDEGDLFFVVESGDLSIQVQVGEGKDMSEVKVGSYGPGSAFGELALIFGSPRAATITASADCKLWSIERRAYRGVTGQFRQREHEEKLNFLKEVNIGKKRFEDTFSKSQLESLAIGLKVDHFKAGDVIIREGESGDTFYLIQSGTVDVFKDDTGDEVIFTLHEKLFFGEKALLTSEVRAATCIASSPVTVYYLTREDFTLMLGNLQDILDGKIQKKASTMANIRRSTATSGDGFKKVTYDLKQLKTLNVLGQGAFGKVNLVEAKDTKELYALKAQGKYFIVKNGQQSHVLNEYEIMKDLDHPNILRVHCAMQDTKFIYFLLDLLPGGELMDYLGERGKFTEEMSRFYAASVLLAFTHIHDNSIAYRDLKPENLVLNKKGYCIVVDFGLAKSCEDGQTWTFCGTPDYLAPEVIRGTGHDWGVDYWGLGILLFELTKGSAPFYANDPSRTTKKILKGYNFVKKPSHFSDNLQDLITGLCVTEQSKRLGRTQGGSSSVMSHRWFTGFDWEGLLDMTIDVPITPEVPESLRTLGKAESGGSKAKDAAWFPVLK